MRPCRGKRVDNGEWVYGWLTYAFTFSSRYRQVGPYIEWITNSVRNSEEVKPATVGQSTGRYDKNGTMIYTNSKLKLSDGMIGFISTEDCSYDFVESEPYRDYEFYSVCFNCLMDESPNDVEVIDNPELLKCKT